jgi:hypothetical protein
VEKFPQGRSLVADASRQGRPVKIATEATVQWVEDLIRADRWITIDSEATALGSSHGLAHSIMHDRLKFLKLCARWVHRELKDREKMNRMSLSFQQLLRYANEWEDVLNRIVAGDESWVYHYQPESKHASMQWWQMFCWWRRGWNEGADMAETTAKRLFMLWVFTHWKRDGTSALVLVEDMLHDL